MLRRLSTLLLVGLALVIGATSASAFPDKKKDGKKPKKTVEERFKALDKDESGDLTLEEFLAPIKKDEAKEKAKEVFKKKDKNGDEKLTLEEFKGGRKKDGKKKDGKKKDA